MPKHSPSTWILQALLLSGACALSLPAQKPGKPAPDLVWPAPPAEPRIKWVAQYRNEFDAGAKKRTSFMDRLTGTHSDSMGFRQPVSVAVDGQDCVYVGDSRLGIVGLDPAKKKMWLFSKLSPEAPTLSTGIAVDSQYVYATDANQSQVGIYDKQGHHIKSIGASEGINRPVGIAVDEARNLVLVVNGGNHQVLLMDRSLKLVKKVGSRGEKAGQFNFPTYCCLLPGKGFAVVDTGNFRVEIFSYEGKYLSTFGKQGDFSGSFSRPKGIAVDPDGQIYVIDATFANFQIFRLDGQVLAFVGTSGEAPGTFQVPDGIAISKDGAIWVADTMNRRIQCFQYLPETKKPETGKAATDQGTKGKS